jgi:hypothetical protein
MNVPVGPGFGPISDGRILDQKGHFGPGIICMWYSLNFENLTQKKPCAAQIWSYKIFSFCEQILKIGANDASGKMLQSAL